jgi:hypothetical protein
VVFLQAAQMLHPCWREDWYSHRVHHWVLQFQLWLCIDLFIYIYISICIHMYVYIYIHSFTGYTTIVVGYIQAYWDCYHSYSWHLSINHNWFTIGSTASYCWCLSHQELAQGFWTNHHWEGIISFKCLIARPVYQYKNMKTKWLAISTMFQCFQYCMYI